MKQKDMMKRDKVLRVAVDLDGTLTKIGHFYDLWGTTFAELYPIYHDVEPNKKMIKIVNDLYDKGYVVYIFTSRYDIYQKVTEEWLKRYGIKYHYFTMNKPFYNILIDDKGYRPDEIKNVEDVEGWMLD